MLLPDDKEMLWSAIQGIYYTLTGIWPVLHYKSFEKVTGPKTDVWLVKMVGLLAACIGINLIIFPFMLLAASTALSFLCVDVIYVLKKVIRPVYLVDAVIQIVLLTGIIAVIFY